ncbi:O-antigen ligase family protein [Rhodococcus ruber]|uniref:O-antigen ligase family protein n=1 Tax=Rhodococcus ruber TaxID=1830 RepID=UPI000FF456F7|nr:O-antigen ligase family protein [Rhodococcus ruber]RQM34970.1 hypothetical protein TN91_07050 [Rhodococcus ruber]
MLTTEHLLRPRIQLLVWIALGWALAVDYPTKVGLGLLSLSGTATLAVGVALVALTPGLAVARKQAPAGESRTLESYLPGRFDHAALPAPLRLFAVVAVAVLVLHPTAEGLQNTAVYLIFILAIPVAAASCSAGTGDWYLGGLRWVSIVVGVIAVLQSLTGTEIYGKRSVALVLVILVAATLAIQSKSRFDRALPYLLILACALTLSRTAILVAAVLIPASIIFSARRAVAIRVVAVTVPTAYVTWKLFTTWAPLRDRFLEGDNAYQVGSMHLNTSGRSVLWELTINSWQSAPFFGHGPGSAASLISGRFGNISHPHNEYLRLLHDFGVVGAALFTAGLIALIWETGRRARRLPHPIHKAAALSLIAVAAVSITDNVLVYPFVMLPVAVMTGLSMAYPLQVQIPASEGVLDSV